MSFTVSSWAGSGGAGHRKMQTRSQLHPKMEMELPRAEVNNRPHRGKNKLGEGARTGVMVNLQPKRRTSEDKGFKGSPHGEVGLGRDRS